MKTKTIVIALFISIVIARFVFAQDERSTITTYYPSPIGLYAELRANKIVVNPVASVPTPADGSIAWGTSAGSRGMLTADQGASIELGGSGTPYIDFYGNIASDYQGRIILVNANILRLQMGLRVRITAPNDPSDRRSLRLRSITCHMSDGHTAVCSTAGCW